MSPPPSHEPEIQTSRTSEESEQLRNLLDLVSRLESRVESLEKELSDTKQTLGTAVLKLIKKVTKLENKLRQKRKRKETEDEEDVEGQDQDIPSQTDQGNEFATPEKSKDSGKAQEEQISPSTLEAAQILTNNPAERPVNTGSTPSAQVNTAELNTSETERVQRREGKDLMTEEDLQSDSSRNQRNPREQELQELAEQEEEAAKEALATEFNYIQARLNADRDFLQKDVNMKKGAIFY
ncbi:hypothetical protein Tco_1578154 [Tanacetum coccineum]